MGFICPFLSMLRRGGWSVNQRPHKFGSLLKTARQYCHLSEVVRMSFCFCIKLSLFQRLLCGLVEGGGRDSGESLKGFGDVLNSGLAKQICQQNSGEERECPHRSNPHLSGFVEA